jgi:hypothetical protein
MHFASVCCHNVFMSKRPLRVSVPVSPEVKAAFERLAAAQGCSVSSAISDWLSDTTDAVNSMADLMEKARQQPRLVAQQLHGYALGLGDLTAELLESFRVGHPPSSVGPVAKPSGPSTVGDFMGLAGLTPPVGNTGGKLPTQPKKRRDKGA